MSLRSRCHICTVAEETNVPNLPPSTLPSRSNPIAGYCLHLSPVLSVLEVIGSPSRCFFFFLWRRQEPLCSPAMLRQPGVMEAPPGTATHLSSDHLLSLTEHIGLLIHSADVFLQLSLFSSLLKGSVVAWRGPTRTPWP